MKIHIPIDKDGTTGNRRSLCGRYISRGGFTGEITCRRCLLLGGFSTTAMVYTKEQLFEVLTYYINGFAMANASSAKVPLANVKRWERCREEIAVQSEALNKIIKEIKRRMP